LTFVIGCDILLIGGIMAKPFLTIPVARADAGRIVDALEANAKLLQVGGYPAEDCCHRIGQHDGVNVYYLVLDGSVDARIIDLVLEKQAMIDKALDAEIAAKPQPQIGYEPEQPKPVVVTVPQAQPEPVMDQATAKAE
jgi:hypothetical protein